MRRLIPLLAALVLPQCASSQAPEVETALTNSLGMPFVKVAGIDALVCRFETRVKEYRPFAEETKVEWPKPLFLQGDDHPAVNVSWKEAVEFCEWLGKKEGRSYRLLTDTEWSLLVGLQEKPEVAPNLQPPSTGHFHWGTRPVAKDVGNFCDEAFGKKYRNSYDGPWLKINDGHATTAPVASYPADANGLYDLSGNVWEWVDGWYDPPKNTLRIVRGGAFRTAGDKRLMASFRGPDPYNVHLDSVGFRIVCEKE